MFSRTTMAATLRNLFLLPPHFFSIALVFNVISLLFSSGYSIHEQGRALLAWKDSLTSSTNALSSWKPGDLTPCLWFGVLCNSEGQVVEISLTAVDLQGALPSNLQPLKFLRTLIISSTNISGTIPKEFGDYNELTVVDVSGNYLSGKIPEEILKLSKLQELHLYGNGFEGGIPLEIGNLSNLEHLTLYDNNLSGEIPKSIGRLRKLQVFRAGGNKDLRGELPMEIGNCSSLILLGLAETGISGTLPSSIGMLKRIQIIAIYSCHLSGPIPEEIGNCSELQGLYLYENNISGPIPKRIGELRKLQSILLWQNSLVGEIPDEIRNCKELMAIGFSANLLTGRIPKGLGELSNLQEIQLSDNQISGPIPSEITNCLALCNLEIDKNVITGEIPVSIGNLKNLTIFYAWENNLTGSIPSSLSDCQNLQGLDLSYNNLVGQVPKQIFGLKNLTKLLLISNNLSGFIPPDIGNCTELYRLRLNKNKIGGTIPSEIGNLKKLNFFDMGENLLVGGLPPSLSECSGLEYIDLHSNGLTGPLPNDLPKSLQVLDISNNRFNGQVSTSIGGLINLTKLDLGNNQLSGKIPGEIVSCSKLQYIDLGNNGFYGELPEELGQMESLEISLNLSCNQFSGEIPSHFSSLTKLEILDLSHNNLSGNLGLLGELRNLVSLNVSFNDFSGELPDTAFFRELPLSNIDGNKGLHYSSGGLVNSAVKEVPHSRNRTAMKVAMPILISATALLILLAIYVLVHNHVINASLLAECENWEITLYQKLQFSIEDIVRNLTSSNVIGTGSSGVVYRVTTPNGETMAVKKMWSSEETGAFFCSEIQTLGSIRHKNIIRLLGWGSNRNLKMLFYDYLPNGSLSLLLHGAGKGGAEWEARYNILLGVAHALSYLHHDCLPPIMHGDVKAMNVLLGPGFEPYLADFGLARIVGTNSDDDSGKPSQTPHLAGSYGYMAPEHATMQRITEKSDVYSFGVVIMEVLTGRHPLDPTLPGGGNLVQWVRDHLASKRNAVAIFDSKLRGRTDPAMHEMLQTLAVALLCASARANDRPTMKDVVAMLTELRHLESATANPDTPKPGMTMVQPSPSPPPPRPPKKFMSQGSSNCSFAFSDDSI